MKFFFKIKNKTTFNKQKFNLKYKNFFLYENFLLNTFDKNNEVQIFTKFLIKNGFLIKGKINMSILFKNSIFFFLNEKNFIYQNYPSVKGIIESLIDKKFNYLYIFEIVANLVKPPFVVKSITIPKKLRKKTKQKYVIKIVYKNDQKRLKNAYKQLYYYSNKFTDTNFKIRLYKSLMFSFLD